MYMYMYIYIGCRKPCTGDHKWQVPAQLIIIIVIIIIVIIIIAIYKYIPVFESVTMVICAHGPAVKLAASGLDPQDAAGAYFLFYFI